MFEARGCAYSTFVGTVLNVLLRADRVPDGLVRAGVVLAAHHLDFTIVGLVLNLLGGQRVATGPTEPFVERADPLGGRCARADGVLRQKGAGKRRGPAMNAENG